MKAIIILPALLFCPLLCFSQQQFKRKVLEYKTPETNFIHCNDSLMALADNALAAIDENNSAKAVLASKDVYDKNKTCPEIYDAYGYSLFRNGLWTDGIAVIEAGIEKFGPEPGLVKRRSDISIEMAQLGLGSKSIDGNSVYKAAKNTGYTEEQFVEENFKSALADLEYLDSQYHRIEDRFIIAKIYQALGNYDKSNTMFDTMTESDSYIMAALFNLAENNIRQKNYADAEKKLLKLANDMPGEPQVYEKLSELYGLTGDKQKQAMLERKSNFYKYVPPYTDLKYNDEDYNLILFLGTTNHTPKEKIRKLREVYKTKDTNYTTDICLVILNVHANHGNGLEEEASAILSKIGKPAIGKVHKMFQTNVSTCTITNLADIMANVKEESSWELLTNYLPIIAQMPATLIPPAVPEKVIKFDAERGPVEILKVVKPLLTEVKPEGNGNPMITGFGSYVYYSPLKSVNRKKLLTMARELNYNDAEIAKLEEQLK